MISANPHLDPEQFEEHACKSPEDVFYEIWHTYRGKWDDKRGTVEPGAVVANYKTAEKLFPKKER